MRKLKFGLGNAKIGKDIHTFSLPSGYSCPGAQACLAKANRETGKITDGAQATFRCYAASMESRFPGLRALTHHNFDLLKGLDEIGIADLICASLPAKVKIVRVHVSGDFYSEAYFCAWMRVAHYRPDIRFYAYTKSISFWVKNRLLVPDNFKLTASRGGRNDDLIDRYGLKDVRVVMSLEEALALGLELDHDDSHAYNGEESFALLIHGQQRSGTAAHAAVRALDGIGSYGKGKATL